MKNINEIIKIETISEVQFYLEYYEMIEEELKNKEIPQAFFKEKEKIEDRLKKLCLKLENKNNSICIVMQDMLN